MHAHASEGMAPALAEPFEEWRIAGLTESVCVG